MELMSQEPPGSHGTLMSQSSPKLTLLDVFKNQYIEETFVPRPTPLQD